MIVRQDLPLGNLAAQIVHAAGESSPGNLPADTHAVVLAVPDERALLEVEERLLKADVCFAAIREPDAPWAGALMTIGIKPQERTTLRRLLRDLRLLR